MCKVRALGRRCAALLLVATWLVGGLGLWLGQAGVAHAGVMTRQSLAQVFPAPLIVGERERDLPVWPIYKQDATSTPVVAYAFESIDFAPLPGFAGVPFNLLVALDPKGNFMDVRVLSQHEPVFLDGLGEGPLLKFVEQYRQLSLRQSIKIGLNHSAEKQQATSANVYIDGVAKATASVRILNQSLLASALKVARAKLGFNTGRDPDLIARVRADVYHERDWAGLLDDGLIVRRTVTNAEVEDAFRGTAAQGLDDEARQAPRQPFVDWYAAYLDVPTVGRNLLSPQAWDYLRNRRLEPGDHALLVLTRGRYAVVGEDFLRGSVPDRLTLQQNGLPLELRDMDLDVPLRLPPGMEDAQWRVFRVIAAAGLDPAMPLALDLLVTRSKGQFMPEVVRKNLRLNLELPARYYDAADSDSKSWWLSWTSRWPELLALAAGLAVLVWALRQPPWLVRSAQRLRVFRTAYLAYTLGFIGWYAQGQLSVVNLTAVWQAVLARQSLGFLLYDPMTVLLWLFVLVSFVLWGRGTFCGWLCPFGALQELFSKAAARLRLAQWRVPARVDRVLLGLKYVLLAAILLSAGFAPAWKEALVEVEPFKTSITLNFVRSWPFVVWAVAAVTSSALVYKGYCRYVCPLGAAMTLMGRLRRFDWIARRVECGAPCQRCRSACAYQAIERSGRIDYHACFQCLDCVVIEASPQLCVPDIHRQRKVVPIAVRAQGAAAAGGFAATVPGGTP